MKLIGHIILPFRDILLTRFNSDCFQRGITLNKYAGQEKKIRVSYFFIGNPNIKFQNPSIQGSEDMACTKKLDERTNGRTETKYLSWLLEILYSEWECCVNYLIIF